MTSFNDLINAVSHKSSCLTVHPSKKDRDLPSKTEPATNILSSPSPPSTATKKECKSTSRSVYCNLIVSFMNSESFSNQTQLPPRAVDANAQTAKCSFNVKFKTANYIPLCHSSPYHVFIFQLHFGSNSPPFCTGVFICDSICSDTD